MKVLLLTPLATLSVLFAAGRGCLAGGTEPPTTNAIPAGIFVTDDGNLFWGQRGKRVLNARAVQAAISSDECQPAEKDPRGNWGEAASGLQLSLRFEKNHYTNGEPVLAAAIIRNVSDGRRVYLKERVSGRPWPIFVNVWRGTEKLALKDKSGILLVPSATNSSLEPQTQHKFLVRLDRYYDLGLPGNYEARAEYNADSALEPAQGTSKALQSQKAAFTIEGERKP